MKNKIKEYIELIFTDAPECRQTEELKEEMYNNICDRYDDLIREGKSEAAAYNISVAGIGDISDLIEEIRRANGHSGYDSSGDNYENKGKNTQWLSYEEREEIRRYNLRAGVMHSIAIALYILCWVPLVILSGLGIPGGEILGIAVMMIMVAAATALIIMKSAFKPQCLKKRKSKDDDDDDDDEEEYSERRRSKKRLNPVLKSIKSLMGVITLVVYLLISFGTGAWHITWIIFLISAAVDNILDAIFELCGKKYSGN